MLAEYWMRSSIGHRSGITFSRGNYSADLVRMLDAVMHHQEDFVAPSPAFPDGLVQIKKPTTNELSTARAEMIEAMEQIGTYATHISTPRNLMFSESIGNKLCRFDQRTRRRTVTMKHDVSASSPRSGLLN